MGCEHQLDGHGCSDDREPGEAVHPALWLFERATKRICCRLNFWLVSLPATLGQAELVAASASETSKAAPCRSTATPSSPRRPALSPTRPVARCLTANIRSTRHRPGAAMQARERLKKWADGDWDKYALGFAYVKGQAASRAPTCCRTHDVKDGHLVTVWGGVKAADNAIMGARAKVSIPAADLPKVRPTSPRTITSSRLAPWETKKAGIPDDEEDALRFEVAAPEVAALGEAAAGRSRQRSRPLIFAKSVFTEAEAKAWAKKTRFQVGRRRRDGRFVPPAPAEPGEFQKGSFRTITLTDGVKAVIGRPKAETAAMADYKDPKFDATRHAYACATWRAPPWKT